jgi:hypothetical protein
MVDPRSLRLQAVKVFFSPGELADLDARRGHFPRPAFLRAAGLGHQLQAAPLPAAVTAWADSARVQACLTQINSHAELLNCVALADGQQAVVDELLTIAPALLAEFKTFRQEILGGHGGEA